MGMPTRAAKGESRPLADVNRSTAGKRKQPASLEPWWPVVLVATATLAAFWPALGGQFLNWDDDKNFLSNPNFRGLGASNLRWMLTTFHLGHYHPLTWVTLAIDYTIWGLNPFGYHLTNLLLHAANAALFYLVALRLLGGRVWTATLAALLFALHPLRVESVAWVTERRDVLAGFFYICSILAYLRAQKEGPRTKWMPISVVCFGAALLSKVIAVSLPVALMLLDLYPLRRGLRWAEKIPYFALAAAASLVALAAQKTGQGAGIEAMAGHLVLLPGLRIGLSLYGLAFYLGKTVFPFGLYPQYTLPENISFFDPHIFAGASVVAVFTIAALALRRRVPALLTAWGCYVVSLLPVLSIARADTQQFAADHHTYLATLGLALLAALGITAIPSRELAATVGGLIVLLLAILSYQQTSVWHDPLTLWAAALAGAPDSAVAHNNLGEALAAQNRLAEATPHFARAAQLRPRYAQAHYNLARSRQKQGDLAGAIPEFHKALENEPSFVAAHDDLGNCYAAIGQADAAIEQYRLALQLDPGYADAHYNLGNLLQRQRQFDGAIAEYQQALRSNPGLADAHNNWGVALDALDRPADAAEQYRQTLVLDPAHADAHNNLGMSLEAQGKQEEALAHYRQAVRLNPAHRDAQLNLERLEKTPQINADRHR